MIEQRPHSTEVVQPWRCPQKGERVWDELQYQRGTVLDVMQDGDADIKYDDGTSKVSKWWRMWVLVNQTASLRQDRMSILLTSYRL